ncbi:MAG: right-handed parallel beta-helix repeat-containing protein [Oligoflexales bacterium]|nr:right-handed parallel beta-helix repeat-containing protein [Oligoflexales bacterium]
MNRPPKCSGFFPTFQMTFFMASLLISGCNNNGVTAKKREPVDSKVDTANSTGSSTPAPGTKEAPTGPPSPQLPSNAAETRTGGASVPAGEPVKTETPSPAPAPKSPSPSAPAGASSSKVPAGPAFYVSPEGKDTNAGNAPSAPFATLAAAQAAMQKSAAVKTVYLMGGTYSLTGRIELGSSDLGESWLAYPGQTPILDGGGKTDMAFNIKNCQKIRVRWLTIQNFTTDGINAEDVRDILIDSNTFKNITSSGWNQAAIKFAGSFVDGKITHNLIKGTGYCGISGNFVAGNNLSGLLIDGNAVYDTMQSVADGGAIYLMDRGHSGASVIISHNIIGRYGSLKNGSKAIYLDDLLSNARVENNIVYGTGQWAVQYHSGDHNTVRNNIFDITEAGKLGLYQNSDKFDMNSNVFACNIVYSGDSQDMVSLWDFFKDKQVPTMPLEISGNIYWGANGNLPNTGDIIDPKPIVANPQFADPAAANYALKSAVPAACFKPIETSTVGPLPNP